MARITVEDCLKKIDSQYDLVLLAKERTTQLNAGSQALVSQDNDKNTVISLREIGEGKISIKTIEDSAINKLRKQQEEVVTLDDLEEENEKLLEIGKALNQYDEEGNPIIYTTDENIETNEQKKLQEYLDKWMKEKICYILKS